LNLSGVPILEAGIDRDIKITAESIIDDVRKQTRALGLLPYPKPDTAPDTLVGIELESLPNHALGQLYIRYTAHAQYVGGQLAELEAAYRLACTNLKHIDAKLRSKLFASAVPKAEVASRAKDDALYQEFDTEVVRLFAMKTLVTAHYRAYDKQAAALSRIISLRELEFEQNLRGSNIDAAKNRRGKGKATRPRMDIDGSPLEFRRREGED